MIDIKQEYIYQSKSHSKNAKKLVNITEYIPTTDSSLEYKPLLRMPLLTFNLLSNAIVDIQFTFECHC